MPRQKRLRLLNGPSLFIKEQVPIPEYPVGLGSKIMLQTLAPMFGEFTLRVLFPEEPTKFFDKSLLRRTPTCSKPGYKWYPQGFYLGKDTTISKKFEANKKKNEIWASLICKPGKKGDTENFYSLLDKLKYRILSADIVFNIPLDHMTFDGDSGAEQILFELASLILPKDQLADIANDHFREESEQDKREGLINGKIKFNITKVLVDEYGENIYADPDSWSACLSIKKDIDRDYWCIIIVVTLPKPELTEYDIKKLPQNSRVNNRTRNIQLEDFFTFARFDWDKFDNRIGRARPGSTKKIREDALGNTSVIADVFSAYQIAKALEDTRLAQQIIDEEFLLPVKVFEG